MQSNSSGSAALSACGEEDEREISRVVSPTGAASNLAPLNISLSCWLHVLSKESSLDLHGDGANLAVRVLIALVYLVVCVLGLVGNFLALFLLHSRRRGHHHSSIDCFVMSLALTDLQFVLTLPFWAIDTVLDFRWPFGRIMCKIVSSVTTMNMYASVYFLTAMSVTRYRSLVTSLKMESPRIATARAKWGSLTIWVVSLVATLPHAFYSTTVQVSADDELCLVRFSDSDSGHWDPQVLLGLYQMQKVLLGFVVPLVIISVCYLLLLRFILSRRIVGSVAYAFPLTVCLAHANSCLNPVLYCLIRREYRAGLKELLLRVSHSVQRVLRLALRGRRVEEAPSCLVGMHKDINM
ncbi:unnamed protein product [Pleuronectes platessa]|uniref:G-protein coupled receptors family 1 profile domain-containing protein n=1 Tax=Pleuronectes platessa TaxID=8262 RepID=A0A9N7VN13_PLEPL|nr:unnamed protein product [Pleuronectes platessa]